MNRGTARKNSRYLVTVADDFGRSSSVNCAIAAAYDKGILTSASVMAGGEEFEEAARIACGRPQLSLGLHVTLCEGRSVLPHSRVPGLTSPDGSFEKNPVKAWLKYTKPGLLSQIEAEVSAQFDRLESAGIHPAHVDSHHHLHMHPFLLDIICRQASRRGVRWVRIPTESLPVVLRTRSPLRGAMPFVEWAAFGTLGLYNLNIIRKHGLQVADNVYGLSRTGDIDERSLINMVGRAAGPLIEIFFHPDTGSESGRKELAALTSATAREHLAALHIALTGYTYLSAKVIATDCLTEGS